MENKEQEVVDIGERSEKATTMIKNHMWGSMAIGLIPVPWVDFLALTGIQLNMLRKLANVYDISFSKDKGKNVIASLLGGVIPTSMSASVASLIKAIPVIGPTTGALTMPVIAGASTYAIGKVFVQHFESGGTFLDFDPDKVKEYFAQQYKEGKIVATDLKKSAPSKA